ncbi:flagellar biosynthetic protein FliO [Blastochloris viridis]|uniref:Flagellar biosynthesis protein FliO n=1 Tax=Blastochloris viridis TaxID=1079 RepID=A0A182CXI8_BLAVI|nr:flagellar biosynthetic protein FliO [Blastochloris viridis]ALK08796.1 Flagellar biosynthesis protein, FliO [Blastochloris viridis]BAR97906.1 hypothetical protein BV133_313 [Blastochloris viridis]
MSEILGGELGSVLKYLVALTFVLGLLGGTLWLVRRFGGGSVIGSSSGRGRMPRLGVMDHATVDGRRRLVLVRRDNVEHLLLIGGPTDIVVESNIVRTAPQPREAPPRDVPVAREAIPRDPSARDPSPRDHVGREMAAREPTARDTMARDMAGAREALAEVRSTMAAEPAPEPAVTRDSPSRPEPRPDTRTETRPDLGQMSGRRERPDMPRPEGIRPPPPSRPEPAPRESLLRSFKPAPRPEPAGTRPPAEPTLGAPAAAARPTPEPQASTPEFAELERLMQPARSEPSRPRPRLSPAEEFAVRRETILTRPSETPVVEPEPAPPPVPRLEIRPEPAAEPRPVPQLAVPPAHEPAAAPVVTPPVPPSDTVLAPDAKAEDMPHVKPIDPQPDTPDDKARTVFDNLEDEMASLLGRGNRP